MTQGIAQKPLTFWPEIALGTRPQFLAGSFRVDMRLTEEPEHGQGARVHRMMNLYHRAGFRGPQGHKSPVHERDGAWQVALERKRKSVQHKSIPAPKLHVVFLGYFDRFAAQRQSPRHIVTNHGKNRAVRYAVTHRVHMLDRARFAQTTIYQFPSLVDPSHAPPGKGNVKLRGDFRIGRVSIGDGDSASFRSLTQRFDHDLCTLKGFACLKRASGDHLR